MNYILMFVSLILLVSCEHHDMHVQQTEPSVVHNNSMYQQVFKYDNSTQCRGGAIAVETMGQELIDAGIDVVCSQKDRINTSRSSVCDGSTGVINTYQINTSNLDDAVTLGFTAVSNITDHRSKLCRPTDQQLDLSTIKIYKYDGSLQCDASSIETETIAGSSLKAVLATNNEIMANLLIAIDIDVLCTLKAHDGVSRTALCGTATGNINVFEIEQSNLAKAKMAGFKQVTNLAHYRAAKCE